MRNERFYLVQVMLDAAVTLKVLEYERGGRVLPDLDETLTCIKCGGEGCKVCTMTGRLTPLFDGYYSLRGNWIFDKKIDKEAFDNLADCLAILSFRVGGITFMDSHYESTLPGKPKARMVRKTFARVRRIRKAVS